MAETKRGKINGAVKKAVSVYEEKWMIKVLANGHSPQAKIIFERIRGFAEKGCWMHNDKLCAQYGISRRTLTRSIYSLWSKGDIIVECWNGYGRKMYAAGHPKVKAELNRQFHQALKDGEISDVEEYRRKRRIRTI